MAQGVHLRAALAGISGALILVPLSSRACGPEFGAQVPFSQAIQYVGFVKDRNGKSVPKATVIISVGEEIVTDGNGGFSHNFGFDEDSSAIQFVCRKDGYGTVMGRKTPSKTNKRTVFVTCSMPKS